MRCPPIRDALIWCALASGRRLNGANGQAIIERLPALSGLEPCEHDKDGSALWISTRPGHLLCRFCYQVAQVLAENIRCAVCANPAGDRDRDGVMIAKLSDDLGAHFYLRFPAHRVRR